jgi:hypothetical protein
VQESGTLEEVLFVVVVLLTACAVLQQSLRSHSLGPQVFLRLCQQPLILFPAADELNRSQRLHF